MNNLRQALAEPASCQGFLDSSLQSIDALIAEAVAKEREACAQIAMEFWCDAGADAIRARGKE